MNATPQKKTVNTKKLVGIGLFTAIVVVLQLLTSGLMRAGMFSVTFVLVPIVVGSAVYDWKAGAWLGFVFSCLAMLDSGFFLAMNVVGTVLTVFLKGTLCGLCAGLVYKLLEKKSSLLAVIAAAITSPVVNTGIFILGCFVFFIPGLTDALTEAAAAAAAESGSVPAVIATGDVVKYIFTGLVGGNFFIELAMNVVLVPVIARLIKIGKK